MGQPREPASEDPTQTPTPEDPTQTLTPEDPTEATPPSPPGAAEDDEEPTEAIPGRWRGSAAVPPPSEKRRRRGLLREPTTEFPAVDATADQEPWPPPPPPRPANAPVTAPYPAPRPPAWNPPGHPPPAWPSQAIPVYPPGYRRRRRRWPWVLGTFALLIAACCGCCISWFQPYAEEYPAAAALPPQAAGLVKLDDPASAVATTALEIKIRSRYWLAEDVFAAIYAEPRDGQRQVVIFGATMFLLNPEDDLNKGFAELTGELGLTEVRPVDAGPAGGHQRCGSGSRDGEAVAVCGWADHGSIAVGIFSGRTLDESAVLLHELRASIITRD